MARVIEAMHSAQTFQAGIVVARFNEWVTKALLEGALNELRRTGVSDTSIHVVWVPGAYEIPMAAQSLCESQKLDLLITLGCIIRGETSHYEHIAQSCSDGVLKVALEKKIPVGFGVLTVESMAQAIDRAGGKMGNKGRDAAKSALEMAQIYFTLKQDNREQALKQQIEEEVKKK